MQSKLSAPIVLVDWLLEQWLVKVTDQEYSNFGWQNVTDDFSALHTHILIRMVEKFELISETVTISRWEHGYIRTFNMLRNTF